MPVWKTFEPHLNQLSATEYSSTTKPWRKVWRSSTFWPTYSSHKHALPPSSHVCGRDAAAKPHTRSPSASTSSLSIVDPWSRCIQWGGQPAVPHQRRGNRVRGL